MKRLLLPLLGLGLVAGVALAGSPCRKPTSWIYPADLTPAFQLLDGRGVNTAGPREVAGCVEAFFRPVPSEAAAQYVPWLGFDNIHIPFALRGDEAPGCNRTPRALCPHLVDLGEGDSERTINALVMLHELAHAEYDAFCRSSKLRARSPRLQRQYDDIRELREQIKAKPGFQKWPWVQAQEMGAYYIETSIHEVIQRIEAVFLVNRFNINRIIQSRADREALVVDGQEVLVADRENSTLRRIFETDPADVGGQRGDAYFEGEPVDHEIPVAMRKRLFADIFGMKLPRTGEEIVAAARTLDSSWAREQRRLIAQARDRRVERLEREAAAAQPGFTDVGQAGGAGAAEVAMMASERALLARIESGRAPPAVNRAPYGIPVPVAVLAHFEREEKD